MLQKKTDRELVEAMSKGDCEAFMEIVERYSQKVHNLALRLSRNEEDAEEILQDVFVTVHRKISSFEGKSAFSSWLYRITVNTAFMKLRRRKAHQTLSIDDASQSAQEKLLNDERYVSNAHTLASRDEMQSTLQRAINKLPFEYRMIFVLRDIDGLSNQAVSSIMKLSVPAIKSRLHRSRLMLRKRLQRFYDDYTREDRIFFGKAAAARPELVA